MQNMNQTTHYKNLRASSAKIVHQVLEQGQSLSTALPDEQQMLNEKDRALMQEICFGIMRVLPELDFYVQSLMKKPLTGKSRIYHNLLLVGIYQMCYTRIPLHAAINETVSAAVKLGGTKLKGLINGVLREFSRQKDHLQKSYQQQEAQKKHLNHPDWLRNKIKTAYPEQWQTILENNNRRPPMWLRINQQHHTAETYQQLLAQQSIIASLDDNLPCALRLETPLPVTKLPGFSQGWVSVQDLSAQYAAYWLAAQNGESILDLCAAPGGKTAHILEQAPEANVIAVDIDKDRLKRIKENLSRLQLHADIKVGDALNPQQWHNGSQFDRILLDAPCSATGVIRRHPDIKWLRKEADIKVLVDVQYRILNKIWPYLKENGILLYATCSILPEENQQQISRFLVEHTNAILQDEMKQHLPIESGGDGFFYAKIKKIHK